MWKYFLVSVVGLLVGCQGVQSAEQTGIEETAAADLGFEEDISLGEESSDEQSAAAEEDEPSDPGRGESGSWDQGSSCAQLLEPGLHEFKTLVDGLERAYWVSVPFVEQAPERYPVIFEFHGSTSSAEEEIALSNLSEQAAERGVITVLPEAVDGMWNVELDPERPNDLNLVRNIVQEMLERTCVSVDKMFLVGFSGGGRLASRVACSHVAPFRGLVGVAGLRYFEHCDTFRALHVLGFHGTDDSVNPYNGGSSEYWNESVEDTGFTWAIHNGCNWPSPLEDRTAEDVESVTYPGCWDGRTVKLYRVIDGGHTWPGHEHPSKDLGHTTRSIDATKIILDELSL